MDAEAELNLDVQKLMKDSANNVCQLKALCDSDAQNQQANKLKDLDREIEEAEILYLVYSFWSYFCVT